MYDFLMILAWLCRFNVNRRNKVDVADNFTYISL